MSDGGLFIPDWVADSFARDMGFPDAKTAMAVIGAAEARAPTVIRDAIKLGEQQATFAAGIVACLRHMSEYYVGDVEIERTLGWIATLIEENAA